MAMLLEYDDVDSLEVHLTQMAPCIKPYHFPPVPPEIVRKGKEDVVEIGCVSHIEAAIK